MSALGQKRTFGFAVRAATCGFGRGLLDLAGFPPHDGQTAVIKSDSEMVRAGALL